MYLQFSDMVLSKECSGESVAIALDMTEHPREMEIAVWKALDGSITFRGAQPKCQANSMQSNVVY